MTLWSESVAFKNRRHRKPQIFSVLISGILSAMFDSKAIGVAKTSLFSSNPACYA